uniref:Uncharacterized protein n=1 Tax=Rhizophora mucronata TaxID=61149 RepID=A0A2P2PE15_RHIMU
MTRPIDGNSHSNVNCFRELR